LYAGGAFTELCGVSTCDSGNTTVRYVAKWNGSSWSALKNGVQKPVYALAASGSDVYVGGDFLNTCGDSSCSFSNIRVNYLARWDGSNWYSVSNGVDDMVEALAVSGSDLYVGGFFQEVCGVYTCDSGNSTVHHIAQWNGSSWSALGYGLDYYVQ